MYNKSWFCCLSHVSLSAFKKHKQQQFSSLKGHFFKTDDLLDTGSIPGKPETFSKSFPDIAEESGICTKLYEKVSNLGTPVFSEPHQMKEYSILLGTL